MNNKKAVREVMLGLVPANGDAVSQARLRQTLEAKLGHEIDDESFASVRDALIDEGVLAKGRGKLALCASSASQPSSPRRRASDQESQVLSYRHGDRRKNNPEVGMVDPDTDPEQPKTTWAYDPHIDPALQFDIGRAQVETLIDDALASGDEDVMRRALEQIKRQAGPYLNWTGKAERTSFEVDTVSLHVHERIDPASILNAVRARMKGEKSAPPKMQLGLFSAPFENLPLRDAIDFYKHEKGWSNRLIAGDSLLVMNSLLQKEGMAGQVQMIYIDPPYGIRYGSNFQPFVGKRKVKDRAGRRPHPRARDAQGVPRHMGARHPLVPDLSARSPAAREGTARSESGSVFVQISDENVHHVREIWTSLRMRQFRRQIAVQDRLADATRQPLQLPRTTSLWYAKITQASEVPTTLFDEDTRGREYADE